ncbi:MAG: hypothetical protein C0506_03315 [Anaerolinea sp.]|nr:hypothetical protein [Anaerolinea sp.]
MANGRRGDIPLEMPLVQSAEVVPAVEDRSYVVFIMGAMVMAVGAGLVLAILLSLAQSGAFGWEERVPWLIQAHGWAQVQGWAGLFVAGMGLRLLPRFAARQPFRRTRVLPVFALLFGGAVTRVAAQAVDMGGLSERLMAVSGVLAGAGAASFSGLVLYALLTGRKTNEPWRWFCMAGGVWWAVWAALLVAQGMDASANGAYVPSLDDDATAWTVMLAAIGNFIWGVQSRAVPVFFGRKTPSLRRAVVPGVLLNAGAAAVLVSPWLDDVDQREAVMGAGFLLSGAALIWLPPIAGSVWGRARRLRPRARRASRFVLAANVFAMIAGALLVWAGVRMLFFDGDNAVPARDAARHAYGAGLITLLIIGMAQLVAPFFALRRVEAVGPSLVERGAWWCLLTAAALRVTTGLLAEAWDIEPRMQTSALAGALGWLGLLLFVAMVVDAIRSEPRMKALMAEQASAARGRNRPPG